MAVKAGLLQSNCLLLCDYWYLDWSQSTEPCTPVGCHVKYTNLVSKPHYNPSCKDCTWLQPHIKTNEIYGYFIVKTYT